MNFKYKFWFLLVLLLICFSITPCFAISSKAMDLNTLSSIDGTLSFSSPKLLDSYGLNKNENETDWASFIGNIKDNQLYEQFNEFHQDDQDLFQIISSFLSHDSLSLTEYILPFATDEAELFRQISIFTKDSSRPETSGLSAWTFSNEELLKQIHQLEH